MAVQRVKKKPPLSVVIKIKNVNAFERPRRQLFPLWALGGVSQFPAISCTISNPSPLLNLICTEASSLTQDRVRFPAVQAHCSTSRVYTCLAQVIMFHGDFSEEEIDIVSIFDGVKEVWFWKKKLKTNHS